MPREQQKQNLGLSHPSYTIRSGGKELKKKKVASKKRRASRMKSLPEIIHNKIHEKPKRVSLPVVNHQSVTFLDDEDTTKDDIFLSCPGGPKKENFISHLSLRLTGGSKRSKKNSVFSPRAVSQKEEIASAFAVIPADAEVVLLSLIGKGSFSKIYSCSVGGMICAMKEIPSIFYGEEDPMKEVIMLEQLPQHKNIVKYISHRQTEGFLQIFQQQYQTSLDAMIQKRAKKNEPFSLPEILDILFQVATGLSVLHQHGIIHRDIKSHNIFATTHLDGHSTFVVGDLDSAKSVLREKASTCIGTPSFMAPETYSKDEYGAHVDVFSFGMLIFELMTLQLPYTELKPFLVADQILKGIPPVLPDDHPSRFNSITLLHLSCICFNPKHRPSLDQILQKLTLLRSVLQIH